MLLMIDNYDSFTYNLVQYFGELKVDVQVHRNDQITIKEIEKLDPEYLVISPGPCTPNEAGISHSWRLLRTSKYWPGVWWKDCSCQRNYAWQGVSGTS